MGYQLDPLFKPKVIAVIGATSDLSSTGAVIVHNIMASDFRGKIINVNGTGTIVHGQKAVRSISKISGSVDLAIIAESEGSTADSIKACQAKGVKALIIATGQDSASDSIHQTTPSGGPIILGPNSTGIIASSGKLMLNA